MKNNLITEDRKKYLKNIRTNKIIIVVTQLLILLGIIVIWEILANTNKIDSFITSQPSRILKTFMNLTNNDLIKHIKVTTYETIIGFSLGTLLGVIIAIILWWSKFLAKVSEPFLVVLNSLPKVALRTNYYNMGRFRNFCNNCYGNSNFINSYNIRKSTRIFKNR